LQSELRLKTGSWNQHLKPTKQDSETKIELSCAGTHVVMAPWHAVVFIADLAEVMKGIRALAPNSPDIAVAIDSNQSLVDNYVQVSLQIQHEIAANHLSVSSCYSLSRQSCVTLLVIPWRRMPICLCFFLPTVLILAAHVLMANNMHLLKPSAVQAVMQDFETQSM